MSGLDSLINLRILKLSNNRIKVIEGISNNNSLENLDISENSLSTSNSLIGLTTCPSLTNINLSQNLLPEIPQIEDTLCQLPNLAVLNLIGNPIQKDKRFYRRIFLYKCKAIKFMDDRPVMADERRLVEAWGINGKLGEDQERMKIY